MSGSAGFGGGSSVVVCWFVVERCLSQMWCVLVKPRSGSGY
nr:MAG TPA: hypothetical protein [Caudoviricetes sp.]